MSRFISTQPDLNAIGSRFIKLLTEPGRRVEFAASSGRATPCTIPKWIIHVKGTITLGRIRISTVTEIIITNPWWN